MLYETVMSGALLKQEDFQTFLGTELSVSHQGSALGALRLDEIESLPGDHRREADGTVCQPFSLCFTSPSTFRLGQGIYDVVLGEGNVQSIFIVPLGPDRSGRLSYQAVFN
jgi:hypothetical protein